MTNDESKNRPAGVTGPTQAKQAGEIRDRWSWIEHSVWTDRMLTRLEQSEPTTVWFRSTMAHPMVCDAGVVQSGTRLLYLWLVSLRPH